MGPGARRQLRDARAPSGKQPVCRRPRAAVRALLPPAMLRLRTLWLRVNASYWFFPSLLSLAALLLAALAVAVDRAGLADPWLAAIGLPLVTAEGARTSLGVIAGAMVGVTATVFSVTLAAVAYASGAYGPRLLTNFLRDRGNQLALGVFVAVFVLALVVLQTVRSPVEGDPGTGFVPQVALLLTTAAAMFAVAVLVFFLHHVPASIRIDAVLAGIGWQLLRSIEARYPHKGGAREPGPRDAGLPVAAAGPGNVEIVDHAALERLAERRDVRLALCVRAGDFVHRELPLAEVLDGAVDEELAAGVRAAFALGESRTPAQDLEYPIDELVEIALRALSPGVNDPFTAVTALHWLGAATASLAARDLDAGPSGRMRTTSRVIPLGDDFAHFVRRGFGSIRAAAAANTIAGAVFLEAIAGAAARAFGERRRLLLAEVAAFAAQAEGALTGPALDELRARVAIAERRIGAAAAA